MYLVGLQIDEDIFADIFIHFAFNADTDMKFSIQADTNTDFDKDFGKVANTDTKTGTCSKHVYRYA